MPDAVFAGAVGQLQKTVREPGCSTRRLALVTLRRFEIFERGQRAVDREVAIIDEKLPAHAILIKAKIDLVARRQVAALGLEIADRYRP